MLIGEVCGEGGGGGAGLRYYTLEHCLSSSAVMLTVVVALVSWRQEIGGKSCMEWREPRHAGTLDPPKGYCFFQLIIITRPFVFSSFVHILL